MPLSVSSTPVPLTATASKLGRLRGFRRALRTDTGSAVGRSLLLYWMTIGIVGSISLASRFRLRL